MAGSKEPLFGGQTQIDEILRVAEQLAGLHVVNTVMIPQAVNFEHVNPKDTVDGTALPSVN